jgi:cysteine-rich repeat protein
VSGQNLVVVNHRQTHTLIAQCQGYPKTTLPCWETFLNTGNIVYNFYFTNFGVATEQVMTGLLSATISSALMTPTHRLVTMVHVTENKFSVVVKPGEPDLRLDSTTSFVTLCNQADSCIPCTEASVWNPETSQCVCPVDKIIRGYVDVGAQAQVRPNEVGYHILVNCSPCDMYQKAVNGVCVCSDTFQMTSAQERANSLSSLDDCRCDAGFHPFNDSSQMYTCVKCGTDSYKAGYGNVGCGLCPPGEHSSVDGTSCECPVARLNVRDFGLKCLICNPGTFQKQDSDGYWSCDPCQGNFVSTQAHAPVCTMCKGATFSNRDKTACICEGNYVPDEHGEQCVCEPEYVHNLTSGTCELCPVDTFKAVLGNEDCTPCPINSMNWPVNTRVGWICGLGYRVSGDTCIQCPRDSLSRPVNVRTYCNCGVGMFLSGDACIPCPKGTYKGEEGDHVCTPCGVGMTTVSNGTVEDLCVCAAGYFINDSFDCEACPVNTYNPFDLATGSDSCLPCAFRFFQPSTGGAECLPQNVDIWSMVSYESRVVGIFVYADRSCLYVNKFGVQGGDKVCWGGRTAMDLTIDAFEGITNVCGDGVLLPLVEQCDDGNIFGGDGCSPSCSVEYDFFCPSAEVIMELSATNIPATNLSATNLSASPVVPSVCCRLGGVLSKTAMCTRCRDREPPFPGVRYRDSDCELEDIDECVEGTDGCVLQAGGVSCANLDARHSGGVLRFECVCAPGLFVSNHSCIAERFRTQFVLEVDHTQYPDAVRLVENITKQVYGVATEMLIEEEGRSGNVGQIRVTLFADSWAAMQHMTGQLDMKMFIETMKATTTPPGI